MFRTNRLSVLLSFMAAFCLMPASAQAQTTSLCIINYGDAPATVGVFYSDGFGGFVLFSWIATQPQTQGWGRHCQPVTNGATHSNRYYVSIMQNDADGRAGNVAFDVSRVEWTEQGAWPHNRTIGATVTARPRRTEATSQGHAENGGRAFWMCMPLSGEIRVPRIVETTNCTGSLVPAFMTLRIDAPLNGGLFDRNEYKLHIYPEADPVFVRPPRIKQ